MIEQLTIRDMRKEDIETIVDIDRRIVGKARAVSWQNQVETYLGSVPFKCLVGEIEGDVVGFLLGDIRGWELGMTPTGWLEVIGVSPEHQGNGIGRKLVAAFMDYCRSSRVKSVHALVRADDKRLTHFLEAAGFRRGNLLDLEQEV